MELVAENNDGCTDTATIIDFITYPEFNTTINLSTNPAAPNNCNPVTATLSNNTTIDVSFYQGALQMICND